MLFKLGTKTIFPTFKKKSVNVNITLSTVIPTTWGEANSYTWGQLGQYNWGDFNN